MRHENLGYLFTVTVDNGFKGREFILRDEEEVKQFGISLVAVKHVLYGWSTSVYGMHICRVCLSRASPELFQYHDVQELFQQDKRYFSSLATPIIGKVIEEGRYKNHQFSFFSHHEHNYCFNKRMVRLVLNDPLMSHRGCVFKTASIHEAILHHKNLTDDLIDYLKTHFSGRGCNHPLPRNGWNAKTKKGTRHG